MDDEGHLALGCHSVVTLACDYGVTRPRWGPTQVVDLIKEYNKLGRNCIALMLDTKGPEVRSGDLSAPIDLVPGAYHPRNLVDRN